MRNEQSQYTVLYTLHNIQTFQLFDNVHGERFLAGQENQFKVVERQLCGTPTTGDRTAESSGPFRLKLNTDSEIKVTYTLHAFYILKHANISNTITTAIGYMKA